MHLNARFQLNFCNFLQKFCFFLLGNWHGMAIAGDDFATFSADVFFDVFEVDEVGMVYAEETTRNQHFTNILKGFGEHDGLAVDEKELGVAALTLAVHNVGNFYKGQTLGGG